MKDNFCTGGRLSFSGMVGYWLSELWQNATGKQGIWRSQVCAQDGGSLNRNRNTGLPTFRESLPMSINSVKEKVFTDMPIGQPNLILP